MDPWSRPRRFTLFPETGVPRMDDHLLCVICIACSILKSGRRGHSGNSWLDRPLPILLDEVSPQIYMGSPTVGTLLDPLPSQSISNPLSPSRTVIDSLTHFPHHTRRLRGSTPEVLYHFLSLKKEDRFPWVKSLSTRTKFLVTSSPVWTHKHRG